jgi:hypothetical protein
MRDCHGQFVERQRCQGRVVTLRVHAFGVLDHG